MVKRLTPGERFNNWVDGLVKIWPIVLALLAALGYTNRDHIRQWVGLAEADGKTEITSTGPTFEAQVKKFSEEVRAELVRIEQNSAAIRSQMERADRKTLDSLQGQITDLRNTVQAWHE